MKLILLRGRPGTGKTTIAEALSDELNFAVFRKDDFYDAICETVNDHPARSKISYAVLYAILSSNLRVEATFILDYPFQTAPDFGMIKEWCSKNKVILKSVLVTCSDERVWAERFNKRAINPAPNQLITDFATLKSHYRTLIIEPEYGELVIDSINSLSDIVSEIEVFINE